MSADISPSSHEKGKAGWLDDFEPFEPGLTECHFLHPSRFELRPVLVSLPGHGMHRERVSRPDHEEHAPPGREMRHSPDGRGTLRRVNALPRMFQLELGLSSPRPSF